MARERGCLFQKVGGEGEAVPLVKVAAKRRTKKRAKDGDYRNRVISGFPSYARRCLGSEATIPREFMDEI